MPKKNKDESMNFERALGRLEEIAQAMESGEQSLDRMIEAFEEGVGLVRFCNERLDEIEKRIEVLVKRGDRETAEPFDPAAAAGGGESGDA